MAGFLGGPGGVGGDEKIFGSEVGGEEGVVLGGRFDGEDVEAGAGDAVFAEGVGEGGFVHEGAASGVDEKGGGFHQGEGVGIDEVFGLFVERGVQGDDVGGGEELVAGNAMAVGGGGSFAGEGLHVHAEGFCDAGDGGTGFAETDDADGLASEFTDGVIEVGEDGRLGPDLNLGAVAIDGGGEIEKEGEDMLGNRRGGVAGNIADGDVALAGGFELDVIEAGGGNQDELKVGKLGEGVLGELNFVGDKDLRPGSVVEDSGGERWCRERSGCHELQKEKSRGHHGGEWRRLRR